MNSFGERLKELREGKELHQLELAKILNVHKGSVSNWENNKRTPDADMLVKIANYFDVTLDYLLGRASTREGIISEAYIDGHHIEFELDRKVFPNGLTYNEMLEKLKALEKLEQAGFKYNTEKEE